jgi:hypothetical protein
LDGRLAPACDQDLQAILGIIELTGRNDRGNLRLTRPGRDDHADEWPRIAHPAKVRI